MRINGVKVPYVEVRREFFRNPSGYDSEFNAGKTRAYGARRVWTPSPINVPVMVSRRDSANVNFIADEWASVRQSVSALLFDSEIVNISLSHDDGDLYMKAQGLSFEISDWSDYSANGVISLMPLDSMWQSEEKSVRADGTHFIGGHDSTAWKTKTVFTSNQTGYEFTFNAPGKTALKDINKIVINYNFIAGDILEIDYSKRRITVNGNDISNALVIIQSNYAELPNGNVKFEASHETDVFYHERYY